MLLSAMREVLGEAVWLMGMRTTEGEYMIVASSAESEEILQDYAVRWKIETLFGSLKTRGCCLEQTHLTHHERLEKLLALVTLAFCWAYLFQTQQVFPIYSSTNRICRLAIRESFQKLQDRD